MLFVLTCLLYTAGAQTVITDAPPHLPASHEVHTEDTIRQKSEKDLVDVFQQWLHIKASRDLDTATQPGTRISGLPAAGYTLQTGFAAIAFANAVFTTAKDTGTNISNVLTSLTYSQYNQVIFPIQASIWTKDNKYNIVVDWRYIKFPSYTYGLGNATKLSDAYTVDYSSLRLHQRVFRAVAKNLYAGIGYAFDYFWDVREVDPPPGVITDFQQYGLAEQSVSSGPTVNLLYDNRRFAVNADRGQYASIVYRDNLKSLGSDNNWQSLQVDLRKYIRFPAGSANVLAFWNYDWFTLGSGNPPYLLLPNTGGDPYSNTGRGYIQGRYRGLNMLYLESEYRFQITHNGLIGGVVFLNAQSVAGRDNRYLDMVAPGYGAGLRLKLNKFSRTNIAIDYGLGTGGSRGFFVNLGEVF